MKKLCAVEYAKTTKSCRAVLKRFPTMHDYANGGRCRSIPFLGKGEVPINEAAGRRWKKPEILFLFEKIPKICECMTTKKILWTLFGLFVGDLLFSRRSLFFNGLAGRF